MSAPTLGHRSRFWWPLVTGKAPEGRSSVGILWGTVLLPGDAPDEGAQTGESGSRTSGEWTPPCRDCFQRCHFSGTAVEEQVNAMPPVYDKPRDFGEAGEGIQIAFRLNLSLSWSGFAQPAL